MGELGELILTGRSLLNDGAGIDANPEYARGIAEFIVELTPGLNQDRHKQAILELLDSREA